MDDTNLPDLPTGPPADEPPAPAAPPKEFPFRRPADYYDSPPERPKARSMWPIGCGGAGCLLIVVLFVSASFFATGGAGRLVGWFFEKSARDLDTLAEPNVPQSHRDALKHEMERYASNAEKKNVKPQDVQPVLFAMQDALSDAKLSDAEVLSLTKTLREANDAFEKQKRPGAVSPP